MIFTVDGRHLCSTVDPSKEAEQWDQHHASRTAACKAIIVLGIGCGYHLRALKKKSRSIRVIGVESSKPVQAAALQVHPLDLHSDEFVDSADHQIVREATREPYAVLVHEATAFGDPTLYQTRNFLLGRTPSGLRWLFQNRGWEIPDAGKFEEGLLSLKSLDPVLPTANQPFLLALRELIA